MKRIIASMVLLGGMAYAATIDTSKAEVKWTAFKTPAKAAVTGTFDDVKFKFGTPDQNQSIESQLTNATATIDAKKVNLNDEVKNQNVREAFFGKFKKTEIKVTFNKVEEGKDKGTILASVTMNGKTNKVPMQYEVITSGSKKQVEKKIVAKGVLDLSVFDAESARANLQKVVAVEHEGLTWPQVEISFEAPVK